jgi:hypothetical protein
MSFYFVISDVTNEMRMAWGANIAQSYLYACDALNDANALKKVFPIAKYIIISNKCWKTTENREKSLFFYHNTKTK